MPWTDQAVSFLTRPRGFCHRVCRSFGLCGVIAKIACERDDHSLTVPQPSRHRFPIAHVGAPRPLDAAREHR